MKSIDFGEQLKAERLKRGMSQHEMADELGVGQTTVALWETGKYKPTQANKARFGLWLEEGKKPGEREGAKEKDDFASRVIRLRAKYRVSQKELGEALGFSKTTILSWERGMTMPSAMHLECLKEWERNQEEVEYGHSLLEGGSEGGVGFKKQKAEISKQRAFLDIKIPKRLRKKT